MAIVAENHQLKEHVQKTNKLIKNSIAVQEQEYGQQELVAFLVSSYVEQ